MAASHIFDSLFGAPPVTLATRRAPSSCFSSLSCTQHHLPGADSCDVVYWAVQHPLASHLALKLDLALWPQLIRLHLGCKQTQGKKIPVSYVLPSLGKGQACVAALRTPVKL